MGFNLIVGGIILLFLAGGGAFIYHGIGSAAVAKHEQQVKVEQDKLDAIAKAKQEEATANLVDMQIAYEKGQSERKTVEKKIYIKGQDIVRTVPGSADCVVAPQGMALLNGARGDLQNTTVADIFGFKPDADAVTIRPPPKPVVAPTAPPAVTVPPAPAAGPRPKPVPLK